MAWTVSGNIKGPKGDTGAPGATGPAGADGAGIEIAGSVATYSALPSNLTSVDAGKGYLVQADGLLYIWDGSAFPADGNGVAFQGPQGVQGPQGPQGEQGPKGDTGLKGDTGNTGAAGTNGSDGAQGNIGPKGDTGATGSTGTRGSKWFTGTGAPGTITGSQANDQYLDTATGDVYSLA